MEKKGRLIFAQVDTISGEVTGFAVGKIMELGAHNVQLVATMTKKNRPGHILLIDTDVEHEEEISRFLARELKVTGYHRIDTRHVSQEVTFVDKDLEIKGKGRSVSFRCEAKLVGGPSEPLSVAVEHDTLVEIQELIKKKFGSLVPLSELRTMIESKLRETGKITIEIS